MPEGEESTELTKAIQNKRWYLTSKTIWVWGLFCISLAGWAVTGIMWYQDSKSNKVKHATAKEERVQLRTRNTELTIQAIENKASLGTLQGTLNLIVTNKNGELEYRVEVLEDRLHIRDAQPSAAFENRRIPS